MINFKTWREISMLDKTMLLGALKNDHAANQETLKESTNVGKIMGRCEVIGQLIGVLESGKFDFVNKEEAQQNIVNEIDESLKNSEISKSSENDSPKSE
jgi:hypothetical protein